MTTPLTDRKCKACDSKTPPLTAEEVEHMITQVAEWFVDPEVTTIARTLKFKNFRQAVDFVYQVAELAEDEGHHPDIFIHGYKNVTISLSTHAIHGLSENDFILAAKINALERKGK